MHSDLPTLPAHLYKDEFLEKILVILIQECENSDAPDKTRKFFAQINNLCVNKEAAKILKEYVPGRSVQNAKALLFEPLLILAAKKGWSKLASLILIYACPDQETLNIALLFSSDNKDYNLCGLLIANGAVENVIDEALAKIYIPDLSCLRSSNARFLQNDDKFCDRLHSAVLKNQVLLVKFFLFTGNKNVNHKTFGLTPLLVSAGNGYDNIVKTLISHPNVDVNIDGCSQINALMNAVVFGRVGIVKILLSCPEIDVNAVEQKRGYTVLILAIRNKHEDIVKLLLSHPKIKVNYITKDSKTALDIAQSCSCFTIVKLLKNYGALHYKHLVQK